MVTEVDSHDSNFFVYYPHIDGRHLCAYSPDGQYLYTGGADSFIRVFTVSDPDADPFLITHFVDGISSLHCSFDSLVVGCEDGQTVTFDHTPKHELTALITRCDAGSKTRCARYGHSGRKIAVASDELLVKVIDVRDTTNIQLLSGHSKPVRALGWNPDGTILVTASSDGTLRVWDVSTDSEEPACIKVIDGLITAADPDTLASVEPLWHPSGKYFVIPTKSHEIVIISRDDWSRMGTFSANGHNSEITQLAWSPNGNYLASSGTDKQVLVWETLTKTPLYKIKIDDVASTLAWQTGPGGNSLSIADETGKLVRWENVIPAEAKKPHPSDGPSISADRVVPAAIANANGLAATDVERQRKQHVRNGSRVSAAGAERPLRVQDDMEDDLEDDDDNWIDDDMDGAYKDQDVPARKVVANRSETIAPVDRSLAIRSTATLSGGQAAFQPGATPEFKNKRRYLAFNDIGLIYSIDHEHQYLVHVEFHDRTSYRNYHFDDNYKCEYAALGERGAAYASPARGDHPSVVQYRPFQSWTQSADWQYSLPSGESVVAIGVGGAPSMSVDEDLLPVLGTGCVVAATDAGYLRFFGAGGLQLHLIDLGEEIVALSVGREWLMVVHRDTSYSSDYRQNLQYTIIDTDTFEFIQTGSIPMMKKVTLSWIGFSSDQIPALYKSNGVLSLLSRARRPGQGRWVPVLDTNTLDRREGKQESYWPVSVSSSQLHCIILKGEDRHPSFPTPLLQELALQMPALSMDGEQGKLEETYMRDSLITGHIKDGCSPDDFSGQQRLKAASIQIDSSLIKIMQITTKADRLEQAMEAARLLGQEQSLEAAAKLANFFHQPGLTERVLLIREARSGQDQFEKDKRESKWGHLIENRTLVDSRRQAEEYDGNSHRRQAKSASALFSKPADLTSMKPNFGDSSALCAPKTFVATAQDDSGHGSSDHDADDMQVENDQLEDPVSDEPEHQSRDNSAPVESSSSQAAPPPPPAKAANPFAKSNKPRVPVPVSSNPFAKKAPIPNNKDLKRSDSFFTRVEAKAQPKKSKDLSKQSTLFDLPPVVAAPAEAKKRGRKRKSDADAEIADEAPEQAAARAKANKDEGQQTKLSFGTKANQRSSLNEEVSPADVPSADKRPRLSVDTIPEEIQPEIVSTLANDLMQIEERQIIGEVAEETQVVESPITELAQGTPVTAV